MRTADIKAQAEALEAQKKSLASRLAEFKKKQKLQDKENTAIVSEIFGRAVMKLIKDNNSIVKNEVFSVVEGMRLSPRQRKAFTSLFMYDLPSPPPKEKKPGARPGRPPKAKANSAKASTKAKRPSPIKKSRAPNKKIAPSIL
jgi:hypothetical protein